MGQLARNAAWARASQREQKHPERQPSNWDIPDLDALSVAEDDRMSLHGIEFGDYVPSNSGGSEYSHPSLASRSSVSSEQSGQSKRSQGSSLSRSALDRHDMAQMAEELKFNYAQATAAQAAAMAQQASELQELRAQLEETNRRQVDYTEGADGVEPWVAEAVLEDDLRVTHLWWYIDKNRYEDEHETMLRNRIYKHLTDQLSSEMYNQNPEGDVRGIYMNVIAMGMKDSAEQILHLDERMRLLTKEGKALSTWLDELYDILSPLSVLGNPKTVAQIRLSILGALKKDTRYSDALRDLKRNPHWSVPKIRLSLEAAAT